MQTNAHNIAQIIAQELNVREQQVAATITLLDDGATVPFVARYRKEATGGLDDTQLRTLYTRLGYLRELNDRRQVILSSIQAQGKLTPELQRAIDDADSKTRLEDLYLPFKPKRRTKGQIAIEAGLEPLADALLADRSADVETKAAGYINSEAGFVDVKAVLEGARYILMERYAEDAELLRKVREHLSQNSVLESRLIAGKEKEGAKFRDYFEHTEQLAKIPSHRALAMLRGRNEGFLALSMNADPAAEAGQGSYCEVIICDHLGLKLGDSSVDQWLKTVVTATWRIKIALQMETEFISQMRERAEAELAELLGREAVFARRRDAYLGRVETIRAGLPVDPRTQTYLAIIVHDEINLVGEMSGAIQAIEDLGYRRAPLGDTGAASGLGSIFSVPMSAEIFGRINPDLLVIMSSYASTDRSPQAVRDSLDIVLPGWERFLKPAREGRVLYLDPGLVATPSVASAEHTLDAFAAWAAAR